MTDIFDEVDEILNEVDTTSEETEGGEMSADSENNFNESELQDIMAEIENLEKEFDEPSDVSVLQEIPTQKTNLQEEIDLEVSLSSEVSSDTKENFVMASTEDVETKLEAEPETVTEIEAEIETETETVAETMPETIIESKTQVETTEPKVLVFEKKEEVVLEKTLPVTSSGNTVEKETSNSEISFSANGQMNLNLSFMIGEDKATLTIDPVEGLLVSMNGVELSINQSNGCKVAMDNGVQFTIPLTSQISASKKKVA